MLVVGGGIVGLSAALCLAERGLSVVLCEKGSFGGEQSTRNWGWCRQLRRDPRELALMLESMRRWEGLSVRTQQDVGFKRTGIMFLAQSEAEVATYEAWLAQAKPYNIDARLIAGKELEKLAHSENPRWKAALYCPTDGQAEPSSAISALAGACTRAGVIALSNCAVRSVETTNGRISAALTEAGRIGCQSVIVAGGVWSRRFLKDLGLRLPQLKVITSVLRTSPVADGPTTSTWCGGPSFRRASDGSYVIGNGNSNIVPIVPDSFQFFKDFFPAFVKGRQTLKLRLNSRFLQEYAEASPRRSPYEKSRTLDPTPDRQALRRSLETLQAQFPALASAKVIREWAGYIDVTPDAIPVISRVDHLPGLVIATGFSGHGFGIGLSAGELAADLVNNNTTIVDPTEFRFSRFTDGSKPSLLVDRV
ncbi:FAD-binding oxidoreductase [Agrobacterium tumefaciens]|uniref:NAD(P)/FAD-dependent oxidoreductase n=1 Tax=Agrobacterium tumefaciens TaxID=358 RepID=UPI003013FAE6